MSVSLCGATNVSRQLKGHFGPVCQLAVSVDGAFIASGGSDGLVNVWAVADNAPVLSVKTGVPCAMLFSPDQALLWVNTPTHMATIRTTDGQLRILWANLAMPV